MATLTSFLKLYKPVTNEIGWDDNMNSNLDILDGFINQFMNVPGFTGAWTNATAYTVGQSALDVVSGQFYHCNVAHTSATTGLFSADRTLHPTFWTLTTSPAQDAANAAAASAAASAASAQQALASSASAANSATAAANSAATAAGALLRTGGTMTGPLFLSRDPLTGTEAATKTYVDGKVGGAGFLPLTGGTLTGLLTLSGPPTVANHATTKTYVDTQVATRFPTSGGTINGAITVAGNISTFNGNILARKDAGQSSVAVWDAAVGVNAAMGFWLRTSNQISFGNVDGNGIPNLEWWVMDAANFVLSFNNAVPSNNFGLTTSGGVNGHRSIALGTGYDMNFDNTATTGKGNIVFNTPKGGIWNLRQLDAFAFNGAGAVGGVGAFVNLSDSRFKENIVTATDNLAYIMEMRPVEFDWIATGKHDYGFISQEMATVMPTCVSPMGIELPDGSGGIDDADPTLGIGYTGIIPILVGAMQEIATGSYASPSTIVGDGGHYVTIDVVNYGPPDDIWASFYTPDATGIANSSSMYFGSGASVDGNSGEADLATGNTTGSGSSGPLYLYTGAATGTGDTGNLSITTGAAWTPGTTTGNSGALVARTGDCDVGLTGAVSFGSGQTLTGAMTGGVVLSSGPAVTSGNSGPVHIVTGDTPSGSSGDILLKVGAAAGAGKQSGYIYLDVTGATSGAGAGRIVISGLPTVDPHVINALWCDTAAARVLKLSAG